MTDLSCRDWRDRLKVGDVLMSPGETFRVVRQVSYTKRRRLRAAVFVIQRCSWTERPSTTYGRTDLAKWAPTGLSVKIDGKFQKQFLDSHARFPDHGKERCFPMMCCDVKGIP